MVLQISGRSVWRLTKEISPALIVLFFSFFFSSFFDRFTPIKGWVIPLRVFIRFFLFTLFFCLPLYVLLPIFRFIVARMRERLLQIENRQELRIHAIKHWIFRPFQGIGIGLLFETKLLAVLQIITGVAEQPFLFFPRGQFQPGRMLVISGITVVISLLLSILWTLDDMGIRYLNRKDQEIKMIGKYIGTLMPIIFGFYGIFSLIADYPARQAVIFLFRTVLILYPPFTVFTVFHSLFLRNREEHFSERISLKKGGIW